MWNCDIHWMHGFNIICGIVLGTIFFGISSLLSKKGNVLDWLLYVLVAMLGCYFSDVLLWMVKN